MFTPWSCESCVIGPVLPRRLRIEIAALIVLKLVALAAIYEMSFAGNSVLLPLARHLFSH